MHTIQPQEFLLLNDNPIIRTKCPMEAVTDDMVLKRIKNANLAVGDRVFVQCLDHAGEKLLAETEYRVTGRSVALKTIEVNDRDRRQFEEIAYAVQQVTGWRLFGQPATPGEIAWNVGKRGYDIKIAGKIAGFHADKETAQRMANGELPATQAA